MNHEKLLEAFIKKRTETSRRVLVSDSLPPGEIKVTRGEIQLSPSFISHEVNLFELSNRCKKIEIDFDTRKEREKRKVEAELELIIKQRWARLHRLNPERADALLKGLRNGSPL